MERRGDGKATLGAILKIQEQHGGAYLEAYSQEQREEALSVLKHIVRKGKHLTTLLHHSHRGVNHHVGFITIGRGYVCLWNSN